MWPSPSNNTSIGHWQNPQLASRKCTPIGEILHVLLRGPFSEPKRILLDEDEELEEVEVEAVRGWGTCTPAPAATSSVDGSATVSRRSAMDRLGKKVEDIARVFVRRSRCPNTPFIPGSRRGSDGT
jgi:hypothetical protein